MTSDDPPAGTFGSRYKALLELRGMTFRDVDYAHRDTFGFGLSPDTQKNWVKRGVDPNAATLFRVAHVLYVNPYYLTGFTASTDPVDVPGLGFPEPPAHLAERAAAHRKPRRGSHRGASR